MKILYPLIGLACVITMSSCGRRQPTSVNTPGRSAPIATPTHQEPMPEATATITKHVTVEQAQNNIDLAGLQQRLTALEQHLAAAEEKATNSRGAYAVGSPSISGWGGSPSILQQLHRAREALSDVQKEVARQQAIIANLDQQNTSLAVRIEGLRAKEERLNRALDERTVALQERDQLALKLQRHEAALAASELERLRAERNLYDIVHDLLVLRPGQTQELLNLQERLRERARTLQPEDLAQSVTEALGQQQ